MDERKRKRMESNRESARRSRVRKQQQMQQVVAEIEHLKKHNSEIESKIDETRKLHFTVVEEINLVAGEKGELEKRLNQLLRITEKSEREKKVVDSAASEAVNVDRLLIEIPDSRAAKWCDSPGNGAMVNNGGSGFWLEEGFGFDFDGLMNPWQASCSKSVNLCH